MNDMTDFVMPYMIQCMKEFGSKVEKLLVERKEALENAETAKKEVINVGEKKVQRPKASDAQCVGVVEEIDMCLISALLFSLLSLARPLPRSRSRTCTLPSCLPLSQHRICLRVATHHKQAGLHRAYLGLCRLAQEAQCRHTGCHRCSVV